MKVGGVGVEGMMKLKRSWSTCVRLEGQIACVSLLQIVCMSLLLPTSDSEVQRLLPPAAAPFVFLRGVLT